MMRDTVKQGRVQQMVLNIGPLKGLIQVLKEIGRYDQKMKLEHMRKEIASHSDFKDENNATVSLL